MGTSSAWTPERRARQAALIRQTRPWEKSTGPRTEEGKATSSRNACRGGLSRDAERALRRTTRAAAKVLRHMIAHDGSRPLSPAPKPTRKRERSLVALLRYNDRMDQLLKEAEAASNEFRGGFSALPNGAER